VHQPEAASVAQHSTVGTRHGLASHQHAADRALIAANRTMGPGPSIVRALHSQI